MQAGGFDVRDIYNELYPLAELQYFDLESFERRYSKMLLATTIFTATTLALSLSYHAEPYATLAQRHSSSSDNLLVDLGYSVYQGHHNGSARLNVFQG